MRKGDQTIRDALKNAQSVLCQYLGPDGNQTVRHLERPRGYPGARRP
jgi:hypothetical protein